MTGDYFAIIAWLASIFLFAKVVSVLPTDPERDCTELGRALWYVSVIALCISAVVTSARLFAR